MAPPDHARFIAALAAASSVEELHGVCSDLCHSYGFDHFIYGARTPVSFVNPSLFILSGFPLPWWEHYKTHNYFQLDPTVAHCTQNITPVNWRALAPLAGADPKVRRFMAEAREHGLRSGVSFPLHGIRGETAMFSLVTQAEGEQVDRQISRILPEVQLLTSYLHESVNRLVEIREIGTATPQLTDREKECLLWGSEGKTTWEVAQILGISERTVIFHLQNAATKLNVSNRQHAIARAISLRLITPQFT